MKRKISLYRAGLGMAFIACAVLCLDCSDLLLDEMQRLAVETNRPEILPAPGTIIPSHEVFTLQFPKSMSGATISLSGSIGGAATKAETTTYADDRLVVSPALFWSSGSNQTLRISVSEGGEIAVYDFTYKVFDGVCVATTGSDSSTGKGTVRAPYATIQNGITQAKALHPSSASEVHVAAGTYAITTRTTKESYDLGIVVQDRVSILGGYALDWKSRDWKENISSIVDNRGKDVNLCLSCIGAPTGVSAATAIEGLAITASSASADTTGIVLFSSEPVIRNNTIVGGGNATGITRSGIDLVYDTDDVSGSEYSPLIEGNVITAGGGNNVSKSFGINAQNSAVKYSPVLRRNTVSGGTATDFVAALFLILNNEGSAAVVERNVFMAGSGAGNDESSNTCVYVWPNVNVDPGFIQLQLRNNLIVSPNMTAQNHSGAYIDTSGAGISGIAVRNNTILLGGVGDGYMSSGIAMNLGTNTELHVDNNIIYYFEGASDANAFHLLSGSKLPNASSTAHANDLGPWSGVASGKFFYIYMNDSTPTKALTSGAIGIFSTSSGNLQTDPLLNTSTGRPTASTPSSVYGGGLDGSSSWGFTNDLDGSIRSGNGTTGWSMGCYEYNP